MVVCGGMGVCNAFASSFSLESIKTFCRLNCRYTDSVMNSYQSMAPGASFAQFYHQAASAVSAASAGVVGVDTLGKCSF